MSTPRSELGPGREFDLIRVLTSGVEAGGAVIEGPGDDAAVLEGGWVVTCDLSIEGVHLARDWSTPAEMGARAVGAALSDLAAMAAEPVAVLLSLAASVEDHDSGLLAEVGRGARAAVEAVGARLIGGDVTRSPGPLVVDVIALGKTDRAVLRRGARPGDQLWVTGALGGAAAALTLLRQGTRPDPALEARYRRPTPRIEAARRLAATGHLHAMMDLSDGLAGDARHLAAASGVGLEFDDARIPLDRAAVDALGALEAHAAALHGGEDYELLFAADPAFEAAAGSIAAEVGLDLTRVGRVMPGRGVRVVLATGDTVELERGGWDHFSGSEGHGEPGDAG